MPFDPSRPAEVLTDPCRVYVYYDGSAKNIEGNFWMPCLENRFRGYGCATHAMDVRSAGLTIKPNAFYNPRTGFLRLAGASKPAFAPKPEWIRRWRWDNGFVVPFDPQGRILPGITAHRIATRAAIVEGCGPPVYSLLAYCSAGGVAIYSRWPLRNGDLIAVSGVVLAGTTTYDIYTYKAS